MDVHSDRAKARLSRSKCPAPPTAAHIDQYPALSFLERPIWEGIPTERASRSPIEIPICINQPIIHERVYRASLLCITTRCHITGNSFAAWVTSKQRNTFFYVKLVSLLTEKIAIVDYETGVIPGAGKNLEKAIIEQRSQAQLSLGIGNLILDSYAAVSQHLPLPLGTSQFESHDSDSM